MNLAELSEDYPNHRVEIRDIIFKRESRNYKYFLVIYYVGGVRYERLYNIKKVTNDIQ